MAKKPLQFQINPLLSGPTLEARNKSGSPYRELDLAEIDVDPEQPRTEFDPGKLAELAASIKEHGLINPILVRVLPGGSYRVVAGERRYRACKLLGLPKIPAIIDQDEERGEFLSKQLVENLQRADLTPVERSEAIFKLKEQYGLSVRELAERLGISKSAVQRALEIRDLPADLIQALRAGAPESKVLLIAQIEDPRVRAQLLERVDSLSRDALDLEVKGTGIRPSHSGTAGRKPSKLSTSDNRIVSELQRSLGVRVQLQRSAKKVEQGRLVLEFYSENDLVNLVNRLMAESPTVGQVSNG